MVPATAREFAYLHKPTRYGQCPKWTIPTTLTCVNNRIWREIEMSGMWSTEALAYLKQAARNFKRQANNQLRQDPHAANPPATAIFVARTKAQSRSN